MCKDDPDNSIFKHTMRISDMVKGLKCTLWNEKTERHMKRMEELSSSSLTLDKEEEVIQNGSMWSSFNEIVDRMGKDLPISKHEMDSCTIMVAALLTFWSWHGRSFVNLPSLLYHPYLVCTRFSMPSLHPFTFLMF